MKMMIFLLQSDTKPTVYINTFSNLTRLFKIGIFTALLSTFEVYGYEGPLFDAMAQLDERPGFEKSIFLTILCR